MKTKLKVFGILAISIMVLSLVIPLLPGIEISEPVYATTGYTTLNITASYNGGLGFIASNHATFSYKCTAPVCDQITGGASVGWIHSNDAPARTDPYSIVCSFDLSSIPAGVDITAVNLVATCGGKQDTDPLYDDFYWSVVKTDLGSGMTLTTDDNPNWFNFWTAHIGGRVSAPQRYSQVTNGAAALYTIPLVDKTKALTKYGSTNMTYFQVMTENQAQGWAPSITLATRIIFTCTTPVLQIIYATPPAERTMHTLTNDADFTGILTGSENVTGVSWLTPRAAFADEQGGWRVEGNPGCAFSYALVDSTGAVLESGNNTIKVNNYYYDYYGPYSTTYTGWVRLIVRQTSDLAYYYSLWGRVEHSPSATQRNLTVSAHSTEYPPYDNAFSTYWVYKNGVSYLYWKSNIDAADMGLYSLKLMAGGDPVYAVTWNATISYLNDYYFNIVDLLNYQHSEWRYIMFSPSITMPGFNSYDGFIINVAKEYTAANCGFWQGEIRKDSDGSILTWTESADFYINEITQGVAISVYDKASGDSLLNATVIVGEHSKVSTRLANVNVMVIDNLGNIMSSTEGFINAGSNDISFKQPTTAGSYQARFTFYNTTLVPDYQYIYDSPFTLEAGGGVSGTTPAGGGAPEVSGWLGWLHRLLSRWGMDNLAGHWMLVLFLIVLEVSIIGIWGKMPLVATVIAVLILGLALYTKWVDVWITALLGIGAGFEVYRQFKKKSEPKEA